MLSLMRLQSGEEQGPWEPLGGGWEKEGDNERGLTPPGPGYHS